MKNALRTRLTGLVILTALSAGAPAQKTLEETAIPLDQLVLRYYTPQDLDRDDLRSVADELFGPHVLVKDALGELDQVKRFLEIEYSIIIRDTATRADEIVRALAEIEGELYPPEEESGSRPDLRLESFEYSPRFLSTQATLRALEGFRRLLSVPPAPGGGAYTQVQNMTAFDERHMLLVRETPEVIAEMKALLAQLDVPVPQANFSFLVIRGLRTETAGASQSPLPAELTQHLQRMLPMKGFDLLASGVLRCSTRDTLRLDTSADEENKFELLLEPSAFDQESGELTLRKCSFEARTRTRVTGREGTEVWDRQGFETALSLRNGEYTVLGSVGRDPLFVVLRMEL